MSRGNIRQRSKRSWTLTLELPRDPETGKRRQAYETVRGTKKAAERRLSELQAKVDKSEFTNPTAMAVSEYFEQWLTGEVETARRASTAEGYRWYTGKYILPRIGHMPLRDLQPVHLQNLYTSMMGRGLSPATTRQAHRIVHRALGQAVKMGLVSRNVSDGATPPRPKRREMATMSPDDVRRFLEVSKDTHTTAYS